MNGVLGHVATYGSACASRLSTGSVVGPPRPGQGFFSYAMAASSSYSYGPYCVRFLGQEGYAGFRFVGGDGALHYGWLRLSATGDADTGTAYEYAYEAAPDTPIAAGAIAAAVLTGSVNQTEFPAEGGLLRYAFTVENTSPEPLPLDLWMEASRGSSVRRTRLLGTGTLPPLARVTRTVRVPVDAHLLGGAYDVRFKVGDPASGRFLTFQRFEITKADPEGAGPDAEPFVVAPVTGDLFAEADAEAPLPGTHALAAPSPNPTVGRSEVTLVVATAQTVTVAVYDALGRRVALLHEGPMTAGTEHRLAFDGSGLPAGVYVVRAVGEAFVDTRALTLTR